MNPSCTHVALLARDIEKSVAFYRSYAGLGEVHRRREHETTVVWLAEQGRERDFVVVIIEAAHDDLPTRPPLDHLGYAVAGREDVDRIADRARSEGILREGPVDAGPVVGYYCIVADPDGIGVEFSHDQALGPYADDHS